MKVLFVVPYPLGKAPSQRFRFEHYLDHLQESGIVFRVAPFLSISGWNNLYKKGQIFKKILSTVKGFLNRLLLLGSVRKFDIIFIHREATPLGAAWFEWIIKYVFKKKIIYDFDDAIWVPATSKNNRSIKWLKNSGKVKNICRWATTVVAGNTYLARYALRFNTNVSIIPTVVDTEFIHNKIQNQDTPLPTIGWTGTFSTLKYLEMVVPVLNELQLLYEFTFIVIADKDPQLPLKNYKFIKWKKNSEIEDLLSFHIGLMPLYDDEISKGKCGFKAIQYMSLGIPAIVSPVGVNAEIVDDGVDGFISSTPGEWKKKMATLLTNTDLRIKIGTEARRKIEIKYSVKATTQLFFELFN